MSVITTLNVYFWLPLDISVFLFSLKVTLLSIFEKEEPLFHLTSVMFATEVFSPWPVVY